MLKNIVLILIITLASIEIGARILYSFKVIRIFDEFDLNSPTSRWTIPDSELGLWHQPNTKYNHRQTCFDVTYHFDSYGMRVSTIPKKVEKKVLLLGDSYAEGYGLSDDSHIASYLSNEDIEVVNGSFSGASPINYLKAAKKYFNESIDKVIFLIYLGNDIEDLYANNLRAGYFLKKQKDSFTIERTNYVQSKTWESLGALRKPIFSIFNHSYFLRHIVIANAGFGPPKKLTNSDLRGLNFITDQIKEIIPKEKIIYAFMPKKHQDKELILELKKVYPSSLYFEDINFSDQSLYHTCNGHLNSKGAQMIAMSLMKFIK